MIAINVVYPNAFVKDQYDSCFGKVQLLRGEACYVSGTYTPDQLGDLNVAFTFTPQTGNPVELPINAVVYDNGDQSLLTLTVASITFIPGETITIRVSNTSSTARLNNVKIKLGQHLAPLVTNEFLQLLIGLDPETGARFKFDLADDPEKLQAIYDELINNPQTGELSITAANANTLKPLLAVNINTAKVNDITINELNKNMASVRFENLTNSALTITGVTLNATGGLFGVALKTEGCNATANHQLSANASCNVLFDVTPEAKDSGELVISYKDLNNDQHHVTAKVDVNNQLSPAAITVQSSLLTKSNEVTSQTVSEIELINAGVFIWDAQAATLATNAEPGSSIVLDNQCVLVQPGSRCEIKVTLDNTLTTDPTELTINGSNLTTAKTIALTLTEYGLGLSAQKGFDAYTASVVPLTLHYLLKNEGSDSETIQTVSLPEGFTQTSDEKACMANMTLTKDQSCEIIAKTNGLNTGDYAGVISVIVVDDKANTHTISTNVTTIVEDNKTGGNLIDIANTTTHYIAAGTTTNINVDYIPFGNELPLSDFNIVGLPSCLTDNMVSGVNIDNSTNTISFTLKNDQATISALQGCKVALDNNDKAVSDAVMVESSIARVFQPKLKVKLEPDIAVTNLSINQPTVNQTIDIVNYSQAAVDVVDIDVSQLPIGVSMLTSIPNAQTPLTLAVGETKQLVVTALVNAVNQNASESNNLTLSYHYKGGEITNFFTKTVTVTVAGIMPTNLNIDTSVVLPYSDQTQVTNVEVINNAEFTWYPSLLGIDYYIENQSGFIVNTPVKIVPPKDGALNCMGRLLGVEPGASCYIGIEREAHDEAVASYTLVIKGVGAASLSKSNNLIGDARVTFTTGAKLLASYEVIHDTVSESLPYTPMVQTIKVTNTGNAVISNLQVTVYGSQADAFEIYNPNSSGTDNGKGSATTNYKGNWCDANFCPSSCTSLAGNSLAPAGVCYYYVHAKQDAKEGEKIANIAISANGLTNYMFTLYNKKAIYIRDYKSLDNGVTWTSYSQKAQQGVFVMAFNGYGQVYIPYGAVILWLKRLDGVWVVLSTKTSDRPDRIAFDHLGNLWAGARSTAATCSGSLEYSSDNGVTWQKNIGGFNNYPIGLAAASNGDMYIYLCSTSAPSKLKKYDVQTGQWSDFGVNLPSTFISWLELSNEGVPYAINSTSNNLYVYNSQMSQWDTVNVPQEIKSTMFSIVFDSEDQLYLGALESTFPSKFVIGVQQSMAEINWGNILNGPSVYKYSTPLYPIHELIIESN